MGVSCAKADSNQTSDMVPPDVCSGSKHVNKKTFNCESRNCNLRPLICDKCAKASIEEEDDKGNAMRICKLCKITEN